MAAGLAYALSCELLGRPVDKRPGDSITHTELYSLSDNALEEATCSDLSYVQLSPLVIGLTSKSADLEVGASVFVMPDMLTATTCGFVSQPGLLGGHALSDASKRAREAMGQLLLCSCLYPDQPLAPGAPHVPTLSLEDLKIVADRYVPFYWCLLACAQDGTPCASHIPQMCSVSSRGTLWCCMLWVPRLPKCEVWTVGSALQRLFPCHANLPATLPLGCACSPPSIACMICVVCGTLEGLPDEQGQAMLVAAELEYEECRRRLHVDGIASRTQAVRPECIFVLLRGCCMGAYVSHVCYRTMLGQLAGSVPVNDWSRLQQVRGFQLNSSNSQWHCSCSRRLCENCCTCGGLMIALAWHWVLSCHAGLLQPNH